MCCERNGHDAWLAPSNARHKLYSTLRVGREALLKRWPTTPILQMLKLLSALPEPVRREMVLC